MKLKKILDDLSGVPEAYHELYEKDSDLGTYRLVGIEEDDSPELKRLRAKVSEFRDNNVKTRGELEKLQERAKAFEGLDPAAAAKARKLIEAAEEEEERKLLEAGDINGLVSRRTVRMAQAHEKALLAKEEAAKRAAEEAAQLRDELAVFKIDSQVREHASKIGKIRQGAEADVLARARRVFRIDEAGKPTPDAAGEVAYGEDGNPLTVGGFVKALVADAPHLFESGSGGGAGGAKPEPGPSNNRRRVSASDPEAFGRNLEAIARGEIEVSDD